MLRDNLSIKEIKKIISSQASRKSRNFIAHDIIHNNTSIKKIIPKIFSLYELYNKLALKIYRY